MEQKLHLVVRDKSSCTLSICLGSCLTSLPQMLQDLCCLLLTTLNPLFTLNDFLGLLNTFRCSTPCWPVLNSVASSCIPNLRSALASVCSCVQFFSVCQCSEINITYEITWDLNASNCRAIKDQIKRHHNLVMIASYQLLTYDLAKP